MAVHPTPTLLLTRPRAAAERFAAAFEGVAVVISPLMEIVGNGATVDLDRVAGLILTSENAVPFLPPADLPAYCVGPRTAAAAQAAGFRALETGPDAESLIAALVERAPKGLLLHAHGRHVRGDIVGRLAQAGLNVRGIAVYDQRALPAGAEFTAALRRPGLVVPLFSPRSAALFAKATGDLPPDAQLLALSPSVAEALPVSWQAQTKVVSRPDGAEMEIAVHAMLARRNSP